MGNDKNWLNQLRALLPGRSGMAPSEPSISAQESTGGQGVGSGFDPQRDAEISIARRVAAFRNQQQQRNFSAGSASRLTGNFNAYLTSLDSDLHSGLNVLRARSRQLCQNNPYGAKFLKQVASNVVGQGFVLQARAEDKNQLDKLDNAAIEQAFEAWSRRGVCDVTGQLSFAEMCRLIMRTVAQDGEVLIRRVRGKGVNRFGYALQILDIDRLQVQQQLKLANGNVVRMGVEINSLGRPVAYWVRSSHPYDAFMQTTAPTVERIPAEDVFHFFIPLRPEQRRGVPWMHAGIERLYHIGELDQSALVAARKGADTLGFLISPNGEPPDAGTGGSDSAPIEVSLAGTYDTLPEGYDIKWNESKYPNEVYPIFIKSALRAVASAMGVAYNSLANDLEGVNFSSIRSGTLEERELWMEIQDWLISAFLIPNYEDWLLMALGVGAITGPTGAPLPATKYGKFIKHEWQGRRWSWVDPQADLQASVMAINNGLKSRTRICAEMGLDRDTVWQELQREQQEAKDMNLNLAPPAPNMPLASEKNEVTSLPRNVTSN